MNLAQRLPRKRSAPRKTVLRENTLPRGTTEAPKREVNARIFRPDTSDADELTKLLGLANDVGQKIVADDQARADYRDSAAATLDFAADAKNEERFSRSRTYRDSWQREGTKRLAIDISAKVTEAVTARLNDADDPATIGDVDDLVERVFREHIMDGQGNLLDFGTAEAKTILGTALRDVRASIIPQAAEAIRAQTDERLLGTLVANRVYEQRRGSPIGTPPATAVDPLAPLPEPLAPLTDGTAPRSSGGPAVTELADDPVLAPANAPVARPAQSFDIEAALADVPPSISRDRAKAYILKAVINEARLTGDAGLLANLEDSVRADGTPSFNPDEVAVILEARDKLEKRLLKQADEAEAERLEANADRLLEGLLSGNPPSRDFIVASAKRGDIQDEFAFSLIRSIEAEERQEQRELRAEQRAAERDADAELDHEVYSMIALRNTGALDGASAEADRRLFESGQLGVGKKAMARFRQLRAASRAGEQQNLKNPEVAVYAGMLKQQYGKPQRGNGTLIQNRLRGGAAGVNFTGMIGHYRDKVASGAAPEEAYRSAVAAFAPKTAPETIAARRARIRELQAKRLREGR